jgi:protein SCO1/2
VVLALALAVLTACGSSDSGRSGDGPLAKVETADSGYHGSYLDAPFQASDVALEDTDGKKVSLAEQDVPLRLVFFGYTNCPDICQVVMSTMASAVTRLSDQEQQDVQGVFVTTDPARDTPKALRSYLDRYDPSFVGLTGSLQQVIKVAERFHIYVAKGKKLPSGGYEVDHGTYVIGVQDGEGRVVWNDSTSPAKMAEDIRRLLQEDA